MSSIPEVSNPRTVAEFDDWPNGRHRVRCRFEVEDGGKKGKRVARLTENKSRTGWNKPKRTTYADDFRIVDGDDGKTYLLGFYTQHDTSISVWASDMKHVLDYVRPEDVDWLRLCNMFAKEVA